MVVYGQAREYTARAGTTGRGTAHEGIDGSVVPKAFAEDGHDGRRRGLPDRWLGAFRTLTSARSVHTHSRVRVVAANGGQQAFHVGRRDRSRKGPRDSSATYRGKAGAVRRRFVLRGFARPHR